MKYALLIYSDPTVEASPEEMAGIMEKYYEFTESINARGINLGGEALAGTETATTVRVRSGETMTTDGPFAETKEVLGGFYLIDVPDLDAAVSVAAELPGSWHGSVEVRPLWDWENDKIAE
ncbi:MAG: YciI family protein [Acidimicrobiia bacterium]|nr:YciI family protein [Acidimicrobiia bacterium]